MTAAAIESHKLDIGRVLGGTFQVIGRNFVTFAILGLVLSGLPTGLIAFVQASWLGGQADELAEALATGLRAFLPLIVVSVLFALAVGFGMVLLIVPGVMIACAWCVAVPSLVADRTGIFGAFSRSAELTRGNRWRVFGLFLVLFVILIVLGSVVGAITAAVLFTSPEAANDPFAAALHPVNIVLSVVQQTISAVLGATLTAVLYVELRRAREGAAPQWLAEIFS